jgi:Zn finger protein HypA/HybF involved in hydrogenase expression
MPKKRNWTDEQLKEAVATSFSYSEVLRKLKLKFAGGTHAAIKQKVKWLKLNVSHFTGSSWCRGEKYRQTLLKRNTRTLEEILVKDSTYQSGAKLKKRLVTAGILKDICCQCGNEGVWCGQALTLQLDHKNGDRTDHRLENLRVICPNCHSQTPNFAGRNAKK